MKLSEASEKITISFLIQTKAYTTIEDVIKDLESAISSVVEHYQAAKKDEQNLFLSGESQVEISRAALLKKEFDRLVLREMVREPEIIISSKNVKAEPVDEADSKANGDAFENNVLTLLGNLGNSRTGQLFTSLRKPGVSDRALEDAALPNGIIATKVVPVHSLNETGDKKHMPTLGEKYPPPAGQLPLALPKQSRHTATRSSSVNWYNPSEAEPKPKSGKRESFIAQPLTTGQWLSYSAAPSPAAMVSPESKRRQRDQALSAGEHQTSISREAMVAHNQAKEDALYRSVYSSFAPDRDDSGALVVEQQKNRLWWRKYGQQQYQGLLELRDGTADVAETNGIVDEDEINEEEIKEAIKNWKPEEKPREMNATTIVNMESPETTREASDLLEEISDLLETLNSHQRVRNLTLATNSRTMGGQKPQLTALSGSPASPSMAEFDVYEMLKRQLTLIVSTLPPYLLAKLDGGKLGALNISTKIQMEGRDQMGTMDFDDPSVPVRAPVRPGVTPQATGAYSNVSTRNSSYVPPIANPAHHYQQSGYTATTVPRQPSSGYLQNPQYSNRPASSNYSSAVSRTSYPPQGQQPPPRPPNSSTDRYNYAPQYNQQQSQAFGSYSNGYRPYSGQNAGSYNYNQQYSTPQARPSVNSVQAPQAYRGSQTDYQQRAVPPQGYGYGSAQVGGSASPHQRSSFSGQDQGSNPSRPQLYHTHSSQYQAQRPISPQVNGNATRASGSPPQQGHLTPDEQAALMDKQKAQLAERKSSTPQPAPNQYEPNQYEQRNGTAFSTPNGVTAGQG